MQHQGCTIPTKGFFLARRACVLRTQAGQLRAPESLDYKSQDLPSSKVDYNMHLSSFWDLLCFKLIEQVSRDRESSTHWSVQSSKQVERTY